ncbi:alpha/beta hydrolase [Aurantibacter crassamenti]|uniref:alpha/beta hydrolase n=1 Tax=Aurantibacter crassamenti TaxID=1837375 RepID=UPI001939AC03|nr:alpha/beta hydrolase-fold protein [Aurantibacter crassamenti]MBM1106927.1 alpha/beta hydrolase [Aurantibacter crassamenti]
MISKTKIYLLYTILFMVFSNFLFGQKLEPKKRLLEPDHVLHSNITGNEYQLYISFPASYSTKDTLSYPVLYVLDGAYFFPTFNQINRRLSAMGMIQDVVIVGIHSGNDRKSWYTNRHLDYTPNSDVLDDRQAEKEFGIPEGKLISGGAEKFLQCIKNEITPLIEKHYKINQNRGIAGHSFGGLFASFCLVNSDGYFNRFGLNSPSLWWDNENFLKEAVQKFKTNKTWEIPPSVIFISVGEKESAMEIPTMVRFSQHLQDINYENIELSWQIFEHESHMTVMPSSMSRTLTVLYANE